MSAASRRVVLTGLGVLSPIGQDPAAFWSSLAAGTTGVRAIASLDASELPCRIAGEIPDFDAKKHLDKKQVKSLRVMARTVQLGVAAAEKALADAGVKSADLDPARFGVVFGSGMIATELEDLAPASNVSVNCQPNSVSLERWGADGLGVIPPLWMLKYLPNMPACHVSIFHNAQGPNNTITEGDSAGLLALGEAYRHLTRGTADFFLVGGADSKLNPLSLSRQVLFLPLSKRNDAPEKAVRPFDKERDGLVIGEGAGVFAVETLEHATRRGARIDAEVVGYGAAFDRRRDGTGLARAIRTALTNAGLRPDDIDHVNAHGLSAVESDVWEARGIADVFGAKSAVPVVAVKSYTGNLGAGASTVELAASVLALKHGTVPASLNYEVPDPVCPVSVLTEPRRVQKPYALKVNFTDLGQCAAVVVKRWNGE